MTWGDVGERAFIAEVTGSGPARRTRWLIREVSSLCLFEQADRMRASERAGSGILNVEDKTGSDSDDSKVAVKKFFEQEPGTAHHEG
nr:hypothetical protein CFP56_22491 [Quercus suber]